MEIWGYSWPTYSKRPRRVDRCSLVDVVNKLDRRRVLLPRDAMLTRYNADVVCLSVRPSQAGRLETTGRIELVLAWQLLSTYLTPCFKEIRVDIRPKIRVLPSGTLSQTLDLENFATARRWRCKQNSLTWIDSLWIAHSIIDA